MLYHAYEINHAAISPMRAAVRMGHDALTSPLNPFYAAYGVRATAAAFEMFINATRRYGKPEFGIGETLVKGRAVSVVEEKVLSLPFCDLLRFRRKSRAVERRDDPKVLMIAPMSGHYATLLRGTVETMLPGHDVYVTDWRDARDVPLAGGDFDLDDYTDYLVQMCQFLGKEGQRPAVIAVCQPGIPMLAAACLMAMDNDPARPASMTLMGSPIDTRRNPKKPNELATSHSLKWFENNVIVTVPWPNKGFLRRVYPGFLQLSGFMSMNLDRHVDAHVDQFHNLVRGDGESTTAHRSFYDEYLAVMDLTADFYLQTVDRVFQRRLFATGGYKYRNRLLDPGAISDIAVFTVEGEKDDITGLGQTEAVHGLLTGLPASEKAHYVQKKVGHYGVFNGARWRNEAQPKIADFIASHRAKVEG